MAKTDSDLFDRLRRAGLRKQAAKTLSGIGEGASKKALGAARSAVSELRALAEEIERRLPSATPEPSATGNTAARGSRSRADPGRQARRPVTRRNSAPAPRRRSAGAAGASGARAPRGQNKAKILESLKAGPKTAAEIAKETGISTGTASATLTKMANAGEIAKADRGYRLPN
jgi:predicted Rossmann fold nucleotide-binding protein DprA/Smf involved in DNA uptake